MSSSLLLSADPNALGEILRAATFPEQSLTDDENYSLGCRHTFEVREDAAPWDELKLRIFYDQFLPEETEWLVGERSGYPGKRAAKGYSFEVDDLQIDCSWFWDGDGILLYGVFKDGKLVRAVENTDCKKNHVWRDYSDPQGWGSLVEAFQAAYDLELKPYFIAQAESAETSLRSARLERRFLDEAEALVWLEERIDEGYDSATLQRSEDGDSELLVTMLNPASRTQAQAGALSRPSGLAR